MPTTELKANALPGIPTTYTAKSESEAEEPQSGGSAGDGGAMSAAVLAALTPYNR